MKGVVRTRVGYAGGTRKNPTYHSLGDHTETIEIDYDPTVISYEQLLGIFWASHSPADRAWSRQYMAAVFYHNEDQKRLAETTKERLAAKLGKKVQTAIIPFTGFSLAEDYHQKYRLRHERDLIQELKAMYPNDLDFVNSTAAARLNGYLDGYGNREQLEAEIGSFGLSPEAARKLLNRVKNTRSASCPFSIPGNGP
jgi:peptide-methionine (S)-S-oxide reductase